jgi:multidrug resistance efflux pump
MTTPPRGIRFVWLLGFLLLLGTMVGAGWVLNQSASGTGPGAKTEPSMLGVMGLGYVDVEDGITLLHPPKPGRVEQVFVKEGDEVREGDLLLSLDNRAAKLVLVQAEADLAAAKQKLADAERQLEKDKQHEIDIQTAKLEAARSKLEEARSELQIQRNLYKDKQFKQLSDDQLSMAENKFKAVEHTVKAQEALLAKLKDIDTAGPIAQLRDAVKAKEAQRDLAHLAFVERDLYAPADGMVLRLLATPGDLLTSQPRQPVIQFCPNKQRIVRVEILQEWAGKIQKGQIALVEDDTRNGAQWKGKVERVSDWFAHRRSILLEPFQYNDVRTLECIVYLNPGGPPVRIGQRVRVTIQQGGL